MEYLFVYGTLLQSLGNEVAASVTANMQLGDYGHTLGVLYDLGEYPALIDNSEIDCQVKGEVYMITDAQKVFEILDEYEGVHDTPSLYSRELRPVTLRGGQVIDCWLYLYQQPVQPHHQQIINGDYMAYLQAK